MCVNLSEMLCFVNPILGSKSKKYNFKPIAAPLRCMDNGGNTGGRGLACIVELFGSDANGRKMIAWGRRFRMLNAEC